MPKGYGEISLGMINSLFVVITMEYYACGYWFAN